MRKRSLAWRLALGAGFGATALHCSVTGERPEVDNLIREAGVQETGSNSVIIDAGSGDAEVDAESTAPADAGPPVFSTSRKEIDFGEVGCGKKANAVTFSLNNNGTAPFKWSSKLLAGGTSQFKISPASGTILPSDSETITVEMEEVPFPGTTTAGFYDDALTITAVTATDPPGQKGEVSIPIKLTAKGAIVRFSPSAVVFGSVALNESSSATFNLINDGNADVELNLVSDNDRFPTSPLGPVVIEAGKSTSRTVAFTAIDVTPQTGTVTLTNTNPNNSLCAALPSQGLAVSGVGSNGAVSISPASISFGSSGYVDCGTQAAAQSIELKNTGNAAFNWEAKLSSGATHYTLSPTSGTVQPSQTTAVQVIPKPIPATSAVTDDLYAGTVEITTTAVNDPVHIINLHQTARGIILKSSIGTSLDFGGVKILTTATKTFSLTNDGNVPVTAQLSTSSPFAVTSTIQLGANDTQAPEISYTPPAAGTNDGTLVITTPLPANGGPARCAPLPANASLKGAGSTQVSVSPSSLSFGLVDCGSTANYQTLTLTNTGPALTFTATFGKDSSSPYTLANDADGAPLQPATPIAVGAGATYKIRVIPQQVVAPASTAANAFGDTLTLTTTSSGDTPKVVNLNMTARGAFLAISPINIQGTDNVCNHTKFYNFKVENKGNLQGDYTIAAVPRQGTPAGTFKINLSSGSLIGGGSQDGVLEMLSAPKSISPGTQQYLGDIVLSPAGGTILCSDAQPKAPLSLDAPCTEE